MQNEKKWFAVYTRAKWEKKVSDLLSKRKVENYCPLNKVVRQWADRKKTVYEPLFNSYVFIHITNEQTITVKQTEGVLNLVYWLGKPAQIKDEEIVALKNFTGSYRDISVEQIQVNINDKVRIINGPLLSREGNVLEVNKNTVKVMLPTLGYALVASIDRTDVEIVKGPENKSVMNYK